MVTKLRAAMALAALLVTPTLGLADGLGVHDAYVRASAGSGSAAAFMVIHNHGTTDDRLVGVITIDDEDSWQVVEYDDISFWGHHGPMRQPEPI